MGAESEIFFQFIRCYGLFLGEASYEQRDITFIISTGWIPKVQLSERQQHNCEQARTIPISKLRREHFL